MTKQRRLRGPAVPVVYGYLSDIAAYITKAAAGASEPIDCSGYSPALQEKALRTICVQPSDRRGTGLVLERLSLVFT